VPGEWTAMGKEQPLPCIEVVMKRQGLGDDRRMDRDVRQILTDSGMRLLGGPDQEAIRGVPSKA
jgi:hypothetical protein